jgi:hypothetical protein
MRVSFEFVTVGVALWQSALQAAACPAWLTTTAAASSANAPRRSWPGIPTSCRSVSRWAVSVDPEPEAERRGPPSDWDGLDDPAADE